MTKNLNAHVRKTLRLDEIVCINVDSDSGVMRLYALNLDASNAPIVEEVDIYASSYDELKKWLTSGKSVWDFQPQKVYCHDDGMNDFLMDAYDHICFNNEVSEYLCSRLQM